MGKFLVHWITVTLALAVAVWILPGVQTDSIFALLVGGLILGFVNATVRPVMTILTLPLTVLTLGLFYLLVNGLAFGIAAAIVPGFTVDAWWWSVLAALLVSLVSGFIGQFTQQPEPQR